MRLSLPSSPHLQFIIVLLEFALQVRLAGVLHHLLQEDLVLGDALERLDEI